MLTIRGEEVVKTLSLKERVIVEFAASGLHYKAIGERIGASEQVVKNHMRRIFDKTGSESRLQLALFCKTHGIVKPTIPVPRMVTPSTQVARWER